MPIYDPKELTQQYHDNTLPDGDYYFECGDHIHKGRYFNPTLQVKQAAKAYGQPEPVKSLITFEGRFIGDLKTVTILAPIPEYPDYIALTSYAKGA